MGLTLVVLWVGALQIMLDIGKEHDWFHSSTVVACAVVAAVAFSFFVVWELTDDHPVVDLTLFARGNFTFGVVMNGLGFGIYFSGVVLLSLWMQQTLGFSIVLAGVLGAPPGLVAALMSPFLARLIQAFGSHVLLIVGFVAFAAANLLRSGFDPEAFERAADALVAAYTMPVPGELRTRSTTCSMRWSSCCSGCSGWSLWWWRPERRGSWSACCRTARSRNGGSVPACRPAPRAC